MSKDRIQDNIHRHFATTVGLITSNGKWGPNVMAAEWAMQISYDPMLLAIFIHDSPTLWNIQDTGTFGVNIAADDQAELVNIAGGYSGTELAKLAIPCKFETYYDDYRYSIVPMIKGCALACQCKVTTVQEIGDHVMVVGKVLSATADKEKSPLIYTRGSYRKIGSKLASDRKTVRISAKAFSEFKRMSGGQFVLKAAAAVLRGRDGKTLYVSGPDDRSWMLPTIVPEKGVDYKKAVLVHLASMGIEAEIESIIGLKRMVLRSAGEAESLRANFVVYACKFSISRETETKIVGDKGNGAEKAWFLHPPKNLLLKTLLFEQT
jgi:flavin reductase (DIM6/NTAB) family NADH-FMN oxidoreductase RutF